MAAVGYVRRPGAKPIFLNALRDPRFAHYHNLELALLGAARLWPAPQVQELIQRQLRRAREHSRAHRITDPSHGETNTVPHRDGTGFPPDGGKHGEG